MSQRPTDPTTRSPKRGGLFAQLLEFFGMTPTVQSGPTGVKRDSEVRSDPSPPKPRCRACYNPATWIDSESRWSCQDHPQAEIMEEV